MAEYFSPGVYIEEQSTLGNAIVPVSTALPAIVGYTEKAPNNKFAGDNGFKPTLVQNMLEYINWFGYGPEIIVKLAKDGVYTDEDIQKIPVHTMYYAMQLYFLNGGGPTYIVSVGKYPASTETVQIDVAALKKGLDELDRQDDATLVYSPDAVGLPLDANRTELYAACLSKAEQQKDRFNIFDAGENVEDFRATVDGNGIGFSAAYYPALNTSIKVQTFATHIRFLKKVTTSSNVNGFKDKTLAEIIASEDEVIKGIATTAWVNALNAKIANTNLTLQPGAAVLGVYCQVDNQKGVWNAPANTALRGVIEPTVKITDSVQDGLNSPTGGKAINAIRTFQGRGTLVWGARTMDANSFDWRYIQVRRTVIFIEQSIKNALSPFVFEPNNAATWVTVRSLIESFLSDVWRQGGLAGTQRDDAYRVQCGLGDTMTAEDILNGRLNINILLALTRPAEFIVLSLSQQLAGG